MGRLASPLVSFLLLDDSKGTLCKLVNNYVNAVLQCCLASENFLFYLAMTFLSVTKSSTGEQSSGLVVRVLDSGL